MPKCVGLECGARLLLWMDAQWGRPTLRPTGSSAAAAAETRKQRHMLLSLTCHDHRPSSSSLGAKQRNAGIGFGWQRGHVLDTFPIGHSQSIPINLLGAPVTTSACPNGAIQCSCQPAMEKVHCHEEANRHTCRVDFSERGSTSTFTIFIYYVFLYRHGSSKESLVISGNKYPAFNLILWWSFSSGNFGIRILVWKW
jgi:hypothetical protein